MNDKVCLRCDWTGPTRARICPSCGAALFLQPGTAPRRRKGWFPRRSKERARPGAAPPSAETFDVTVASEPLEAPAVTHRGGWIAGFSVLLVAAIVVGIVQRTTPPPPPEAPAQGLRGVLIYSSGENLTRSRLWLWNLETGELNRGPSVLHPLELIDAYRPGPGEGWVGLTSVDDELQVGSLLRNFTANDVPTPFLRGDLVTWAPGGQSVTAATKEPGRCSLLVVESRFIGVGDEQTLFDSPVPVCGDLEAIGRDRLFVHLGIRQDETPFVARIQDQQLEPYALGATFVAVAENGQTLVVPGCDGAEGPTARRGCGGVVLYPGPRYGDRSDRVLVPESFLGWSRDGLTGYVLGSFGDTRGVYALPPIERPTPPELVLASLATDVFLTETYDGGLFVSRDGALILIEPTGERIPLRLPDGAAQPDGPILWIARAGAET